MFTTLVENQAQSRNARHADGVGFLCSSCWLHKPVNASGGTGYGVDAAGRLICYECCNRQDLEDLRARPAVFYCYVSSDKRHVTSWPGGVLGKIHAYGESRSGWHGATVARFRVLDAYGQWWQGRSAGAGMCCTLRPMKAPKK